MAVTWITAEDLIDPSNPLAAEAAESASWILFKLSGEKYGGLRTATDWYGLPGYECGACGSDAVAATLELAGIDAHGHYFVSPSLVPNTSARGVRLRGRPVRRIGAVVDANGETLPSASYRLVNSAYLIETGGGCWDLARGITVTYDYGVTPPAAGKAAAIKLGNEFLYMMSDPEKCSLPDRVSAVSRQGISYTILDPQTFLQDGRTGVYEIDLFLQAANPNRAKKKPRVFSPDTPRGER